MTTRTPPILSLSSWKKMFHPGNYEGAGKSRTKTIWQALNFRRFPARNGRPASIGKRFLTEWRRLARSGFLLGYVSRRSRPEGRHLRANMFVPKDCSHFSCITEALHSASLPRADPLDRTNDPSLKQSQRISQARKEKRDQTG